MHSWQEPTTGPHKQKLCQLTGPGPQSGPAKLLRPADVPQSPYLASSNPVLHLRNLPTSTSTLKARIHELVWKLLCCSCWHEEKQGIKHLDLMNKIFFLCKLLYFYISCNYSMWDSCNHFIICNKNTASKQDSF